MYTYEYARPSVTATIALIVDKMLVVQAKRARKDGTYAGFWSLPGGFLEAKREALYSDSALQPYEISPAHPGETIEQTAVREIKEELGIDIDPNRLVLVCVHSSPITDPRAHVVNIVYAYDLSEEEYWNISIDLNELSQVRLAPFNFSDKLAFNHSELLEQVYRKYIVK